MRFITALIATLICFSEAGRGVALEGIGASTICAARAPSQASAAGLTKLSFCDTLLSTATIDLADTKNPAFRWFVEDQSGTIRITPSDVSSDGTGVAITAAHNINSAAPFANAQNYVGSAFSGDIYYEADIKFDPASYTGSETSWAAEWSPSIKWITQYDAGKAQPWRGIELDCIEQLPQSGSAQSLYTVYDENDYPTNGKYYGVSQNAGTYSGGTAYHTYGCLWKRAANHGGTGSFTWYVDNVQVFTLSYSSGSPSTGCNIGTESCAAGAFMDLDGDSIFLKLAGCAAHCPITYRNVHVWLAP